ncbi:hypothetical protein [Spirosoma lituiforme]
MKQIYWIFILLCLPLVGCKHPDPATPVINPLQHLQDARDLLAHISQANTTYQHSPSIVTWKTASTDYQSYTDCSGFINALFQHSYQVDSLYFKTWMGVKRPHASDYYEAIVSGNKFNHITQISDMQPGDVIALKFLDRSQHEEDTGHCLLMDGAPIRMPSADILLANTVQYSVRVMDSTGSPHSADTRRLSATEHYPGLGEGTFRFYADLQGRLVGYSWGVGRPLDGFDPLASPIAVGRQTAFGAGQ